MSKMELRDQAKALLLKGCYRMAFNKYTRLIEMGSQGFAQREWAVVHLNQGICLQFQEQFDKAIDSINRSIQIDPTYEKSYYRKLQILRDTGRLEEAIHSVPLWNKNKQIEGLLKEIKQEHLNSMGMDQILQDLLGKKNHTIEFIKVAHAKFVNRIIEEIESGSNNKNMRVVGEKISNYYKYAKQNNQSNVLDSFLQKIHYLLVKQKQSSKYAQSYENLLQMFWHQYEQLAQPMSCTQFSQIDIKTKQQYKIVKYCPLNNRLINFLQVLLISSSIKNQQTFQLALQMCNNLKSNFKDLQICESIYNLLAKYINKIDDQMSRQTLKYIKRYFMLIDSLIKFHLLIDPKICFGNLNKVNTFYLHYFYINSTSQIVDLSITPFKTINSTHIIAHIQQNIKNFLTLYLFQHFITKLDRNMIKELIPAIQEQLDVMKEIKNMARSNNKKNQWVQLQQQFVLIYSSLLLKIDLKHQSNRINVPSIISKSNKSDGSLSDMQINTLLLLAISSKQNMIQIVQQINNVTNVISQFISSPFTEQIENVKVVTSFIYLLVINLQDEQEENFAKKMGTTVQEIRKARKIQGQKGDEKVIGKLLASQAKCREHISKNWTQIIPNYCGMLSKIKDQSSLKKWGKILHQIGRIEHTRFFNPKILAIILQCYKYQKTAVGELLCIMCKKVNVSIIKYQYLQSITTILVQNIELSSDQLVIFESLLGLINFTSNTSTKVKIPIKTISNAVFEENKYIVHAACSLLNNLLAVNEEEISKQTSLKDIVQKYVKYYREQIGNDEGIPLTDYSHPSRVYCTLLSLAMVLDLDHIPEFHNWTILESSLLKVRASRSEILYKSIWYMSTKGRSLGKWWTKFQQDLHQLQMLDKQRWLKLQQYIKK